MLCILQIKGIKGKVFLTTCALRRDIGRANERDILGDECEIFTGSACESFSLSPSLSFAEAVVGCWMQEYPPLSLARSSPLVRDDIVVIVVFVVIVGRVVVVVVVDIHDAAVDGVDYNWD